MFCDAVGTVVALGVRFTLALVSHTRSKERASLHYCDFLQTLTLIDAPRSEEVPSK